VALRPWSSNGVAQEAPAYQHLGVNGLMVPMFGPDAVQTLVIE
jgi:hypothetical protein